MYENFHKQFSNAIESIHSGSKGILESFSEYCDLTESAKKKSFKCKGLPRIKKVMRKPFLF